MKILLTEAGERDTIRTRKRARSSMAEQRPFKPFVEGSIPSALTEKPSLLEGFSVDGPH